MNFLQLQILSHFIVIILLANSCIKIKINATQNNNNNNNRGIFVADAAAAVALENFTLIDFLKDVKRLHGFQYVLMAYNQTATIAKPFITAYAENSSSSSSSSGQSNFADSANINDNSLEYLNASARNFVINIDVDDDAITERQQQQQHFLKALMLSLQVPVLHMTELSKFYLKQHFSTLSLSLVYIDDIQSNVRNDLLSKFVASVNHMTLSKIVFLLNAPAVNEEYLKQLFTFCGRNKLLNVVALFADYQKTARFYTYTNFPEFAIEIKHISAIVIERQEIFPNRLNNFHGYKLRVIVAGSEPRVILYLNATGDIVIEGYIGHFIETFAKKFNCTLFQPFPISLDSNLPSTSAVAMVRNNSIDIPMAVTFPNKFPYRGFTYPIERVNWCLMLPIEPDIPGSEFYTIVFEGYTFALTIGLLVFISVVLSFGLHMYSYKLNYVDWPMHPACFRGVLNQPFIPVRNAPFSIRFIYICISVLGILLGATYNSYFATYLTSAPKETPLRTLDDIYYSGTKVFVLTSEYNELFGRMPEFIKYDAMIHKESDFNAYLKKRDSFDTDYIYTVPTIKWTMVKEQQKIFVTPIFRLDEELCFINGVPLGFPVHENSIFLELLSEFMLDTAEAGLTVFWQRQAFFEMIRAGKLSFADLSEKKFFEAMPLEDLKYIWIGYGVAVSLCTLIFLMELLVYYWSKIWKTITLRCKRLCGRRIAPAE